MKAPSPKQVMNPDTKWCEKHSCWMSMRRDGKYLCPYGHKVKKSG